MRSTIFLGDPCDNCGESAQVHLQNPFGVRIAVLEPKSGKTDYIMCSSFIDRDGNVVSRDDLFNRVSRS